MNIDPQHPDEIVRYTVDFTAEMAKLWQPGAEYALGEKIRPAVSSGFDYEATTPGRTAGRAPRWPKAVGATVSDGSVTWTCRASSTDSLEATLSSVAWAVDDGMTVASDSVSGMTASALVSGGQDGQDYDVTVTATFSDTQVRVARFTVRVRASRLV